MSVTVQGPANIYDASGDLAVAGASMATGAAEGNVVTSDAAGNLSLQPPADAVLAAYSLRMLAV